MLINLNKICTKYRIRDFGVLHIGAHLGEERSDYHSCSVKRILWVEANPDIAQKLSRKILGESISFEKEDVLNEAISDVSSSKVMFNVSNNTQSSSLLEFGSHAKHHPHIGVEKVIEISTRRIDEIAGESPSLFHGLDFVNLDIQGMEFAALKSFGNILDQFKWIYTEVNRHEVYKKNGMIWDIDQFLLQYGFFRQETEFTSAGWGDALYVKQKSSSRFERLGYQLSNHWEYLRWKIEDFPVTKFFKKCLRKIRTIFN